LVNIKINKDTVTA